VYWNAGKKPQKNVFEGQDVQRMPENSMQNGINLNTKVTSVFDVSSEGFKWSLIFQVVWSNARQFDGL
jgi:hypothetical protein